MALRKPTAAPSAPAPPPFLSLLVTISLAALIAPTAPSALFAHGLSVSPPPPPPPKYPPKQISAAAAAAAVGADADAPETEAAAAMTRRTALAVASTAAFSAATTFLTPQRADASPPPSPLLADEGGPPERTALLRAIASRTSDDEAVARLIADLEPLDPSKFNGATSPYLGGKWELIYSVNAEAFSPLLNLPPPIRPTSLQLLGEEAADEVGGGRVAQILNFPVLPLSLVLSSGAVPVRDDSTTLEIFPPFRLEVVWDDDRLRAQGGRSRGGGSSGSRYTVVESGSDAEFRALNARDGEAQAAGRNMYRQRYLETSGEAGDLRISEVVEGDPVIVGEVFIHRRL